jgi:hypothetical protein
MATDRITITIDEDVLAELRARVGPGEVSAYVVEAVRAKLQRDPVLDMLDQLDRLDPTGPLTQEELTEGNQWLAAVLDQLQQTSA